jgi:hypothetical protein
LELIWRVSGFYFGVFSLQQIKKNKTNETQQQVHMSTVKIFSSDGKEFESTKKVLSISTSFKNMFEDIESDQPTEAKIPATQLAKIIEFCQYYSVNNPPEVSDEDRDELEPTTKEKLETYEKWLQDFCPKDPKESILLMNAAFSLEVAPLLKYMIKQFARSLLAGEEVKNRTFKTDEEIRKMFNIKQVDLTPEEEKKLKEEYPFADLTDEDFENEKKRRESISQKQKNKTEEKPSMAVV